LFASPGGRIQKIHSVKNEFFIVAKKYLIGFFHFSLISVRHKLLMQEMLIKWKAKVK
jgi:hypothetical protein